MKQHNKSAIDLCARAQGAAIGWIRSAVAASYRFQYTSRFLFRTAHGCLFSIAIIVPSASPSAA